jgi:hypothetical protein
MASAWGGLVLDGTKVVGWQWVWSSKLYADNYRVRIHIIHPLACHCLELYALF